VATLAVIISSILILRLERLSPEGNIKTGEDALWWALVTITTVGYGDFYPVSDLGRIIGAIVIIVGVGLYGVIISFLASNFISQKEIDQSEMINQMSNEITEIKKILQDKDSKE
jgi:voltage-gated potassium channel